MNGPADIPFESSAPEWVIIVGHCKSYLPSDYHGGRGKVEGSDDGR